MEKNELKNVLSALEADNAAELNSRTGEHRFPKSFERHLAATVVCRFGQQFSLQRFFVRL